MVQLKDKALQESPENHEEVIESLEEKNSMLEENIERLIEQKKIQEKKNKYLQEQIDELLIQMKESEKHIENTRKNSTLNNIKIEPKIYLKGMFESFVKEKNALAILIEGKKYYYPLHEYQCKHLPVAGSRVLIFKGEEGANLIYGFNISELIENAPNLEATLKFSSPTQKRIKLHIENHGFLNFNPADDFWDTFKASIGDTLILKQISIDGDIYYYVSKQGKYITDRNKILKILLKD